MNNTQREVLEYLRRMEAQDSTSLFFAEDKFHKQYQWMKMERLTTLLWTPEKGLVDQVYIDSFNEYVKHQRN